MSESSCSYKITVTLKQQTPMLHFQADIEGATLRPSEVKPKLDRFLQEKYNGTMPKEWLLKQTDEKKQPALKYQMRIRAEGYEKLNCVPTIYYGNSGDNNTNKAFCVKGDCELTIICFDKKLKEFIDESLAEFFVTHNFGRMQDKGFGSYIVEGKEVNIPEALIKRYGAEACYCISGYSISNSYPYEEPYRDRNGNNRTRVICPVFDDIKNIYQVMKSGYNFRGYHRSVLFEYFHDVKMGNDMDIGNEKAFIKKKRLTPRYRDENGRWHNDQAFYKNHSYMEVDQKDNMYRYVRALLGLSEQFEYQTGQFEYENGRKKEIKAHIKIEDAAIDGKDKIERFASPIFFKVIGATIFIVAGRMDNRIYKKTFLFKNPRNAQIHLPTEVKLKTPQGNMFDIDAFMEYFYFKFNNRHLSDGNPNKEPIRQMLHIPEMRKIGVGENHG